MHIPDGYLAPAFSVGMGVVTVPSWVVATRRVSKSLNQRTVPLLAIFAALCFTIMMFNVPVPGGTTAHGVGGTLVAIVLGPSAAIIVVSTALIIQALFFGDGGILAIFANCLNMGIVLPFVGYCAYRLIAGRAPLLSTRQSLGGWHRRLRGHQHRRAAGRDRAGLAAHPVQRRGTAAVQPVRFGSGGAGDACSRTCSAPRIVEGIITAFGVRVPAAAPRRVSGVHALGGRWRRDGRDGPDASARPLWQLDRRRTGAAGNRPARSGWIDGRRRSRPTHFGADWSSVDWSDVGDHAPDRGRARCHSDPAGLVRPAARDPRRLAPTYVAIAIVTPIGLIAPGFAYGEGGPDDLQKQLGYVPQGLQDLSGLFSAPLSGLQRPAAILQR